MWTAPLQFCLRFWREALIILLLAGCWLLNSRLESVKVEFEKAKLDWAEQVRQAQAATDQQRREYDEAFAVGSDQVARMVAQVETTAWANFQKKYPHRCFISRPPAGVQPVPAAPATGASAPQGAGKPDAASGEQLVDRAFVDTCGRDAARLNAWIEVCKVAKCDVIKEK